MSIRTASINISQHCKYYSVNTSLATLQELADIQARVMADCDR